MVKEGIVLGHKISERGIEVDKAKVGAIEKMSCPNTTREKASSSAGFRSISSVGARATNKSTNKALQLTLSSSAA